MSNCRAKSRAIGTTKVGAACSIVWKNSSINNCRSKQGRKNEYGRSGKKSGGVGSQTSVARGGRRALRQRHRERGGAHPRSQFARNAGDRRRAREGGLVARKYAGPQLQSRRTIRRTRPFRCAIRRRRDRQEFERAEATLRGRRLHREKWKDRARGIFAARELNLTSCERRATRVQHRHRRELRYGRLGKSGS